MNTENTRKNEKILVLSIMTKVMNAIGKSETSGNSLRIAMIINVCDVIDDALIMKFFVFCSRAGTITVGKIF